MATALCTLTSLVDLHGTIRKRRRQHTSNGISVVMSTTGTARLTRYLYAPQSMATTTAPCMPLAAMSAYHSSAPSA